LIFPNSKLKEQVKFKPVLFSSFCCFVEDDEDACGDDDEVDECGYGECDFR
jgi:hypothetical protein